MKKLILIAATLVSNLALGQSAIELELRNEFDNAPGPATLEDLADVDSKGQQTCSAFKDGEWVDQHFGIYEAVTVSGAYKGRGPRFPDSQGKKLSQRGLVYRDLGTYERDKLVKDPNAIAFNGNDLFWTVNTSNYARVVYLRKSGPYIYFKTIIDKSEVFYGYCWQEKGGT